VALAALGPRLDGIGHVVAQQPALRVGVQQLGGPVGVAGVVDAAQRIERRAVPEGGAALLGQQTVVGQQSH